ncbi:MAG TPA: hypothetical protein EYP98_11680 [Planctomycetes bacterium]|nr:hypothetical protein [Planctomycetota bacterium]
MTHSTKETLLGSDFAAICARFGAPMRCEHEQGVLRLVYGDAEGKPPRGEVELVDGVVTSIAGQLDGAIRRGGEQNMVGWPVELVLPKLGKPLRTVQLGDNTRFEFRTCIVTVHEGTVVCVVPLTGSSGASA